VTHKSIGALLAGVVAAAALASARPAAADDPLRVAVGQKGAWDTMVTYACVQSGICKKAGLDIAISWTAAGPETLQFVVGGTADIGVAVATPVTFSSFVKGAPIKVIGTEFTGTGDAFWWVKSDSPIKSMADTTGKTVAFSRPGGGAELLAHMLAKQAKAEPTFVPTGEASATRTQVMSNQVDVGWGIPPFDFDLLAEKKIRIIARGSDVPEMRNVAVRLLIVNAKYLAAHRDIVVRYMKAYVATVDWMYAKAAESVPLYAALNEIPLDVAKQAAAFTPKSVMRATVLPGFEQAIRDAVTYKYIEQPLTKEQVAQLVDLVYTGK
jgi:NitT/TauT family transport system substrate-binding protein